MTMEKNNLDNEPEKDEEKDENEKKKNKPTSTAGDAARGGSASDQMADILNEQSDINAEKMIGDALKGSLAGGSGGLSDTQIQTPAAESEQSAAVSSMPTPRPGGSKKDDEELEQDSENTRRLN